MTEQVGRRERKKQQTRQAISDVATTLFIEHGFDAVTVADVARAADVAVQTVFNHFPTKEDLFFDEHGWWTGPMRSVMEAPDGTDPVDALERHYRTELQDRMDAGHLATWTKFNRTIEESPALLARRRQHAARMEEMLGEALHVKNPGLGRLKSRLIAAQYSAAQKVLEEELVRLLPAEPSQQDVDKAHAQLESAVEEVFAVLRHGLSEESV
jgi:AcrR family transcriptional regulator